MSVSRGGRPTGAGAADLAVVGNALGSIADEMHATLVRSARSTNVKDRQDTSSSILTPHGDVVAQSEVATPVHLGTNHFLGENLRGRVDWSTLREGDAIVTNLPYPLGPGHLNDVAVLSPVVAEGRLLAIVANQAHHADVGGGAPGSMPFGVTEIYQEGLQIPPIRLVRNWDLDPVAWPLVAANVRDPDQVEGDLRAQVAANALATRRLRELAGQQGPDGLAASFHTLLDYGERRGRAVVRAIPDGNYRFEDVIEGDGIDREAIRIRVTVVVDGDSMTLDFRETDDSVQGPVNCRRPSVAACAYYVLKAIGGSDLPANAGAFRPLRILTRPGSLLEATHPQAVCNANIVTTQRIVDVLLGALRQALPERIGAASSGTMSLLNIGTQTRDGRRATFVETYGGGQGAWPDADGMDGVQTHMTNTRNAPVEVIERDYELFVEGYGLQPGSAGRGRQRGGAGIWRRYRIESERAVVTLSTDRMQVPPWGVDGGLPGARADCRVLNVAGRLRRIGPKATLTLVRGERIEVRTPGGGGCGNPAARAVASRMDDSRNGLVHTPRRRADRRLV